MILFFSTNYDKSGLMKEIKFFTGESQSTLLSAIKKKNTCAPA